MRKAVATLMLCMALAAAGAAYAAADDVPAAETNGGYWHTPTAWAFIQSRPELRNIAQILEFTGFREPLSRPFRGTLLLPTNEAVLAYVDKFQYNAGDVTFENVIRIFWETLMKYHVLPRAAYTRQRRAVTFDTTHVLEPVPSTTPTSAPRTIGRPPTTPSGNFHTVTFLSRSNSWMHPRGEESANTFGHLDAAAVRDEQGNDVTFASRNNEVSGGGVAHIMNAVLQPDDLFPSMSALLESRPDLSIFSSIIDKLNLTTIWPLDCYWISAEICYNVGGLSYNETVAKTTDRCFPCAASSYGCSGPDGDGLFFCGQAENKFPAEYYGTNYCPGGCTFVGTPGNYTPPYMPPYMPTSGRRMLQQNSASSTPFATGGTRAFEGYAGTFALPNNNALNVDIGSLDPLRPEVWQPIVQNHFVAAARPPVPLGSDELVRYDSSRRGGFGARNARRNFLGQMRNDGNYELVFSASNSGCRQAPCLSIEFPVRQATTGRLGKDKAAFVARGENLNRPGTNLQSPGHFYHIIDKVMKPPCGTDAECNRPFKPRA